MSEQDDNDVLARRLAIEPQRSVLLQAPAGSGKTTVLTQRFLRLLAVVDEPEEILAITFTRKAAGEMRQRIVAALQGRLDPAAPTSAAFAVLRTAADANARRRGWDLASLPLRLRVQTIDSFNHWLASRLPVLSRSGARLTAVDDASALYALAARRTLQDCHDEQSEDSAHAEGVSSLRQAADLLLRRLDNDWRRTELLLADMLERRNHWLRHLSAEDDDGSLARQLAQELQRSLESITRERLREASLCLAERMTEGTALAVASAAHRAAQDESAAGSAAASVWLAPPARLADDPQLLPYWAALADIALKVDGDLRASVNVRDGFPPTDRALKDRAEAWLQDIARIPGARDCLRNVRALPPVRVSAADRETLAALAAILRLAAAELQLVFQQTGRVDHVQVAAAARTALGPLDAPTEMAMRVGVKLRHLLVDEFQDISLEQFWLLEALTAGWQSGDGRSLFLVGDPMQSIYQFREAEVGLFLRARAQGIGALQLQSLALTRNFRSVPALTRWINATFSQIFPAQDDMRSSAVSYLTAAPSGPQGEGGEGGASIVALSDAVQADEATRVVQLVRDARAADPTASIAILLGSRAQAPALVHALRSAGHAVRGVELEPLAARPAVRDVVALLRALLHRGDRAAWLAVLRAPWCGLSLAELTLLHDGGGESARAIWEAIDDLKFCGSLPLPAQQRLARCREVLRDALEQRGRGELVRWLEGAWLQLGGPAACGDAQDVRDVRSFLDALALQLEVGGPLTAANIDALAAGLYADTEAAALDRGPAGAPGLRSPVDILTIHAAKGLEWDVVILPGLHRHPRSDQAPLLRWLELPRSGGGSDLIFAPLALGQDAEPDPLAKFIDLLRRQRRDNERQRLAYVACTRARRELHLLGYAAAGRNGELRPAANSLLRVLWPGLQREFLRDTDRAAPAAAAIAPADLAEDTDADDDAAVLPQFLARLPAHWQPPPMPPDVPAAAVELTAEAVEAVLEYSWVGQTARAVGTLVHAELERFSALSALPDEAGLQERAPLQMRMLEQLGVAAASRPAALARARAALLHTLQDARGRWLLSSAHREARSELKLSGRIGQRLVNVIIDRSFIDAQGTRWVVDFKTSGHEGADLESFLARELARYAPQLRQYVALATRLGGEPVRAALYFPLLGAFREFEDAGLSET